MKLFPYKMQILQGLSEEDYPHMMPMLEDILKMILKLFCELTQLLNMGIQAI